jgi:hypothetical protein
MLYEVAIRGRTSCRGFLGRWILKFVTGFKVAPSFTRCYNKLWDDPGNLAPLIIPYYPLIIRGKWLIPKLEPLLEGVLGPQAVYIGTVCLTRYIF